MRFVPRKQLPHDQPKWIGDDSVFFVTIHCADRGRAQLTLPSTGESLLEAAAYYHQHQRWFARLFLLMPDHLHALLSFPKAEAMRAVIRDWKRYTARHGGIEWQTDFFEHRLRNDGNWQLKADYIRQNPVRKGLVAVESEWPWVFEA